MVKHDAKENKAIIDDTMECVIKEMMDMKQQLTALISKAKSVQKLYTKRKVPNIKSGFVKQVQLSETLSDVIGMDNKELVSRSVVNKKINEYIKAHNLQLPENKQHFYIDEKLSTLFGLEVGSVVHYFKMQTYLKSHYPKTETMAVEVAAS